MTVVSTVRFTLGTVGATKVIRIGPDGRPKPPASMSSKLRRSIRAQLIARDGWTCWRCGHPISPGAVPNTPGYASIDHVIPRALGGSHHLSNLRLAHIECNARAPVAA